jgi:hypothetical protein
MYDSIHRHVWLPKFDPVWICVEGSHHDPSKARAVAEINWLDQVGHGGLDVVRWLWKADAELLRHIWSVMTKFLYLEYQLLHTIE